MFPRNNTIFCNQRILIELVSRKNQIFITAVLIFLGCVFFVMFSMGCSDRKHLNLLDPDNPVSAGIPRGFSASSLRHDVLLKWHNLEIDDISGYRIYRKKEDETEFKILANVRDNIDEFEDAGLNYNRTVLYRISAFGEDYESKLTDAVSITPGPNNFWVLDWTGGFATRLSYDGSHRLFVTPYAFFPYDLAVDTTNKRLWIVDRTGYLVKLSQDGENSEWISGFEQPSYITIDDADDEVWMVNR